MQNAVFLSQDLPLVIPLRRPGFDILVLNGSDHKISNYLQFSSS